MKKKILALLLGAAMVLALSACGGTDAPAAQSGGEEEEAESNVEAQVEEAAAESPGAAGFTEIPIFEDEEVGNLLNVSAVYFQPVPMAPGQEDIENFDLHLECDVSALDNTLGYGVGDWVPYLTVDYAVVGDNGEGETAAEGTFMVMSASDGPHYGANISLPEADTYAVTFTFHSPAENGYLIHSDAETGPGGVLEDYFGEGNLSVTVPGWDYMPQEW